MTADVTEAIVIMVMGAHMVILLFFGESLPSFADWIAWLVADQTES